MSSTAPPFDSQSLTVGQMLRLAKVVRTKLAREASCPDHRLGRLVGHANLLDVLVDSLDDGGNDADTSWFVDTPDEDIRDDEVAAGYDEEGEDEDEDEDEDEQCIDMFPPDSARHSNRRGREGYDWDSSSSDDDSSDDGDEDESDSDVSDGTDWEDFQGDEDGDDGHSVGEEDDCLCSYGATDSRQATRWEVISTTDQNQRLCTVVEEVDIAEVEWADGSDQDRKILTVLGSREVDAPHCVDSCPRPLVLLARAGRECP